MATYDENLTERLVRYSEAKEKKPKVDHFVEAEILGDEDVPVDGDDDMLSDLPPTQPRVADPTVFANLEEEMGTREQRKRTHRDPDEDEEEQARTMKYQTHES